MTHHSIQFLGGSTASFLTIKVMEVKPLIVHPSSAGIDQLLAILASGVVSITTQYLLMKWSNRKTRKKLKNDETE